MSCVWGKMELGKKPATRFQITLLYLRSQSPISKEGTLVQSELISCQVFLAWWGLTRFVYSGWPWPVWSGATCVFLFYFLVNVGMAAASAIWNIRNICFLISEYQKTWEGERNAESCKKTRPRPQLTNVKWIHMWQQSTGSSSRTKSNCSDKPAVGNLPRLRRLALRLARTDKCTWDVAEFILFGARAHITIARG